MSNDRWLTKDTITVQGAATKIGIKKSVLEYHIQNGTIECRNDRILRTQCEEILYQKRQYIGIKEFITTHDSSLFVAKYVTNRNKYVDFLEINDYFGVKRYTPEGLLFSLPETEDFYISVNDIDYLNLKSICFFEEFGLSEKEKINHAINITNGKENTKRYLIKFEKDYLIEEEPKPSYTYFVKVVLSADDVKNITPEEIESVIDETEMETSKKIIIEFYNYVASVTNVKYKKIFRKPKEAKSVVAYPYDKYIELARILFNNEYDVANKLTIRALDSHIIVETWLFISLHFVCGWRASDICDKWVYLNLHSSENPFKIKLEDIKSNILSSSISHKTYTDICDYSTEKLSMMNIYPSKTHTVKAGNLKAVITPELKVFFGRLILIAEYHHFISGEGYMKSYRVGKYLNWMNLKNCFGDDILKVTGKNNLQSRRLNKSYLQGIESAARDSGYSTLMSHIIASYARNHTDINTTLIYLKDHGLTGESADVVIHMMMQRGVMSMYLYNVLATVFPDSFNRLNSKEQTELMDKTSVSALELETYGIGEVAKNQIYSEFAKGSKEEAIEILKAMYSVGQGLGRGKDNGIFCQKRALGYACVNPTYESCIANLCPYHIFTTAGIPSLIKVIKEYNEKIDSTGNNKYKIALKKVIIPAFQEIINEVIKNMADAEKKATIRLIEDKLYEYNVK